jgi:hypothetical protein
MALAAKHQLLNRFPSKERISMPIPDSERPPVLAHRRFQADRAAFDGLDLATRFKRIHESIGSDLNRQHLPREGEA